MDVNKIDEELPSALDSIDEMESNLPAINDNLRLHQTLEKLKDRGSILEETHKKTLFQNGVCDITENLRFVQLRHDFDKKLLQKFYEELMIPNFPKDEERDALEDWISILSPEGERKTDKEYKGPWMNVILLVVEKNEENNEAIDPHRRKQTYPENINILGGIVYEYYRVADCGLISYMVVAKESRRKGVIDKLHDLALIDLKILSLQENLRRAGTLR